MISVISPKAFAALMAGASGRVRLTSGELSKAFPGHGRDYWLGALSGSLRSRRYRAGAAYEAL